MIHIKGLNKWYPSGPGRLHALKDIHLDIEDGDYLSVMGPSGSGKSTLLNILGLLDSIDTGEYTLQGVATHNQTEEQLARLRAQHIGFIFQNFQLIARLSARENIELPLILAELPVKQRNERVDRVLEQVGLLPRAHHRPAQLSGGQLQRVAIARAVVIRPAIILADEPTGNLDRSAGQEVVKLLESLNSQGMTVIMVTHDPEIGKRARRRLGMSDGALWEDA